MKLSYVVMAASLLMSSVLMGKATTVTINGQAIEMETQPIVKDGVTFVPVRFIAEHLGAVVDAFDGGTNIAKSGVGIHLEVGNVEAGKDQETLTLAQPPMVVNNRIYVPLRFIGEAFGCQVNYNEQTGIIAIEDPNNQTLGNKGLGTGVNYIPSTNSISQLMSSGYFVQEGDWLYYSNTSQKGKLYRCKGNFTEKELVSEDEDVMYINFCGDFMYYVSGDDFVVQHRDGSQKVKVNTRCDEGYYMSYPYIIGDWVYYIDNPQMGFLIRMKLDGSEKQQLTNARDTMNFATDGSNVYYSSSSGKTFKIDAQGNVTKLVDGQEMFGEEANIVWDELEGELYVTQGMKLYKTKDDLKTKTEVADMTFAKEEYNSWNCRYLICDLKGDWLYYINVADGRSIYRYQLKTGEGQKLNHVKSDSVYVTEDRVYYRNLYTLSWEQIELED